MYDIDPYVRGNIRDQFYCKKNIVVARRAEKILWLLTVQLLKLSSSVETDRHFHFDFVVGFKVRSLFSASFKVEAERTS